MNAAKLMRLVYTLRQTHNILDIVYHEYRVKITYSFDQRSIHIRDPLKRSTMQLRPALEEVVLPRFDECISHAI